MNKSKSSSPDDKLSELLDSLIFHIFWNLPIRDVVRTTILSKRWRNLWTTSPFLNFTDYCRHSWLKGKGNLEKFRNFCNRALLLWRGAKLLKFKVILPRRLLSMSFAGDINVWVRFAKEKGVNELYLDQHFDRDIDPEFESLWSCSSLEVLSIKHCPFSIGSGNVKWDRLKSLTVKTYDFRPDLLSKVLCGSPLLEMFVLDYFEDLDKGGKCYIQSNSLKKLSIKRYSNADEEDIHVKNSEMRIQTPNLETLEISGDACSPFSVDVGCLTGVTLGFGCIMGLCTSSHETDKSIEEALKKILPSIQHVESVTLSECCLEVLGVMNRKSPLSPLSKVKLLRINASTHMQGFSKPEQIAGVLQIFPKLKRLVIEDTSEDMGDSEDDDEDDYQDDRESLEFEAKFPSSLLMQLRTVEVTWGKRDKSIFLFIETLLKYARKLEKMVFRVNDLKRRSRLSKSLFLASQKLLSMPRSSPSARLIFCKN